MPAKNYHIPRWALWLIHRLCREELHEEIEGNLIEYRERLKNDSQRESWKFFYQVLTYLRPSTLKSFSQNSKFYIMFNFNILQTIRGLWMHRSTTLLNISGYALGMLCVSVLFFYIKGELAYDNFHVNKNEIYRVIRLSEMNGEKYKIGVTSGPFAPHLALDFPIDIKSTLRIYTTEALFEYEDKVFKEDKLLFADPNFFQFFSFPLAVGDPATVLDQPNAIVLTKQAAKKYFGEENPLGKTLILDKEEPFVVAGVMGEWPADSHLDFDFLGSLKYIEDFSFMKGWWNNGLFTYVQVESPLVAEGLNAKFPQFMDKYFVEDFKRSGKRIDIGLEALKDIYFDRVRYDWARHGNREAVILLTGVAMAILFIACFNYLNLAIALSFRRAKEIGMRKVLGGNKLRLVLQFLGESAMVCIIAITLAIGLTEVVLPTFNSLFDLAITTSWYDPLVLIFFAVLILVTILLSGLYPAILLSMLKPLEVFKGQAHLRKNNLWLRKGLVIAQFSISIFMIISTLIIKEQLDFVNNKSLGFDREAIVMVDFDNDEIGEHRDVFRERLLQSSKIKTATSMSGEPGGYHDATTVDFLGDVEDIRMRTAFVDENYLSTFNIELATGRDFSNEYRLDDAHAALVNEKALQDLGLSADEALGVRFRIPMWDTLEHVVVGVTKDYHFNSLREEIEPLMIVPGHYHRRMGIRLDANHLFEGLREVEEIYADLAPSYPISYEFMDDSLERLYAEEKQQSQIFQMFSGVSIFLACLGIFGLVSFVVERRRKEFGIRKALGASVVSLLQIISKEFVGMIGVASLISIPLAWYAIQRWLENFAYRIDLVDFWGIFLIGAVLALLLALVTIFMRSLGTANANPTESLRYE
ncbi:putative ABC transport system permease protein [Reichenbachiella faecimaris]|uniref:Putative ABC transport system permease protein n=1 Tax=Reichenbachiella faecimaris TaxID=692418 RepID=A0A1W2GI39_REIFA|nr:ABC transporter permease [Reichenbachiella faecimaris]SMD36320.1 putative ABC transport system permease protein [Reichenbachiella faecimaris]